MMYRRILALMITAAIFGACGDDRTSRSGDSTYSGNGDGDSTPDATPTTPYGSSGGGSGTMSDGQAGGQGGSQPLGTQGNQGMGDARVAIASTQGNQATGQLTLSREGDGVRIRGQISGLAPNAQYGFHIHETGDCSAPDASSAGEHFNPTGQQHGNPTSGTHHAGDLTNISSDASGNAQVDVTASGVTLGGDTSTSIVGKALIVHEGADDYSSQPAGDSGKRLGCGVIELAS